MSVWRLCALSVAILLLSVISVAQAPPRDRPSTHTPTGTATLRGRVVAADTGSPLRRAQVRAVGGAVRTTRLTTTDAEGRYEVSNLPAWLEQGGQFDPAFRKQLEPNAKRLTLIEGQTATVDLTLAQ